MNFFLFFFPSSGQINPDWPVLEDNKNNFYSTVHLCFQVVVEILRLPVLVSCRVTRILIESYM